MRSYFYHPDHFVYVENENKKYMENLILAKFDIGPKIVTPDQDTLELYYESGIGMNLIKKDQRVETIQGSNINLEWIIDNIDTLIAKKKTRENFSVSWDIPDDMLPPITKEDENAN
jgi:hypothetical protein